jgi:hypothetical protein
MEDRMIGLLTPTVFGLIVIAFALSAAVAAPSP